MSVGAEGRNGGRLGIEEARAHLLDVRVGQKTVPDAACLVTVGPIEERDGTGGLGHAPDLGEGCLRMAEGLEAALGHGVEGRGAGLDAADGLEAIFC